MVRYMRNKNRFLTYFIYCNITSLAIVLLFYFLGAMAESWLPYTQDKIPFWDNTFDVFWSFIFYKLLLGVFVGIMLTIYSIIRFK